MSRGFPNAADLTVPPKPVPPVAITTSTAAATKHDAAVEAWGDGLALKLGAVCRWAKARGGKVDCPREPKT